VEGIFNFPVRGRIVMPDLNETFEQAAREAQRLPKKPDNQTLLQLYGLYKQATVGNAAGKRPGFTDPVGQAKHDAWNKLQGMPKDSAMQAYIDLVKKLKG
jgi:diazepam-binding inhibitor (GABA receptor modulator, acyl-CoA-binding protein)